jgi:hypothetical protein
MGGAKHYQLCKDAHIGFTLMIMKNYMPITNLPQGQKKFVICKLIFNLSSKTKQKK